MKLLADENIHGDIVAWLRSRGHDVLYAAETFRSEPDDELLAVARREERILITDDKDLGELVFRRRLVSHGVILMRLASPAVEARLRRLEEVWAVAERMSPGKFMVITDSKVRIRASFGNP